jgi:hypothetical protein
LDAHPAVSVWVVDPSFRRIGDAYVNLRAVVAMGYDEVAGRRQASGTWRTRASRCEG